MMGGRRREPIDLLLYKGKKNLTKQEIEERQAQEVKAPSDKVKHPNYLPKDLRKEFKKISDELMRIGIMTNLDVDALARFLYARKMYLQLTAELLDTPPTIHRRRELRDPEGAVIGVDEWTDSNETYSELLLMQDKLFKQCRQSASDLGLTISSRCRLVIPKDKGSDGPSEMEKQGFGDV
ncbi:phage terminase small subunit P27 family [Paenibacillus mucilaginosus]|uniref:phage terminase small subunit P27 family n=1 Tax=Paenibacillus mucilaginosus TaxID=61624 RepID=UPI003D2532AA